MASESVVQAIQHCLRNHGGWSRRWFDLRRSPEVVSGRTLGRLRVAALRNGLANAAASAAGPDAGVVMRFAEDTILGGVEADFSTGGADGAVVILAHMAR